MKTVLCHKTLKLLLISRLIFAIQYGQTRRGVCLWEVQAHSRFLSALTAQWVCVEDAYLFFHWLLRSCAGNRGKIRPPKQSHSAVQHITGTV